MAVWTNGRNYTDDAKADFLQRTPDYYLVAQAHAHGHTVVTHERPEPQRLSQVKIPDVCTAFDVTWVSTFDMLRTEGATFVLG